MTELSRLVRDVSNKYSMLKDEVDNLVEHHERRIYNGACEQYEIECCYEAIKNLVKEFESSITKFAKTESLI